MTTNNSPQIKTYWDLESLFPDIAPKTIETRLGEVKQLYSNFVNTWKDNLEYLERSEVLKKALDDYSALLGNYGPEGNVGYYFELKSCLDQRNPKIKASLNKVNEGAVRILNDIQFFEHRITRIAPQEQHKFLSAPDLVSYKHFLERLFLESKYILSEPEEKIVNLKQPTSYTNWVRMTEDFISRESRFLVGEDGKRKKRNFDELSKLIISPSRDVRTHAAKALNNILAKVIDTAEVELNSVLQHKKTEDTLRGFTRPDASRHLDDDVDSAVVDVLLESVESMASVVHDFYKFKAKLFNLPTLTYAEKNMEYGELSKVKYSVEETVDMVSKVFRSVDPKFEEILKDYIANGHVDIFPKISKNSSEFHVGGRLKQPGFILLNHSGYLTDVLTFAHEFGHALNTEFMRKKQNALNFDVPMCVAEVSSTFMENLVLQELVEKSSNEVKLALKMKSLDEGIGAIFRQVACYRFEQDIHSEFADKGYLSKPEIGKLFIKNMQNYLGDAVTMPKGTENWWVYISHIRVFFYVYSYASGLLISRALWHMYKSDTAFIYKIKEFLSTGKSKSPKQAFLDLGIDISSKDLWLTGLKEYARELEEAINLAKSSGKN